MPNLLLKRALTVLVVVCAIGSVVAQNTAPLGPPGMGPGVHSPLSPFKPLTERSDVISWKLLTGVTTRMVKGRLLPSFSLAHMALNQKTQRVQGFMMPLQSGQKQAHFLLTSVPPTCSFCMVGGPESVVEIKTKTPVSYTLEAVTLEGRFLVLYDDPLGIYYRMLDAVVVN